MMYMYSVINLFYAALKHAGVKLITVGVVTDVCFMKFWLKLHRNAITHTKDMIYYSF